MSKISDIPNESHYAIITESHVTIPGDERSRTNPGHGYPEHTEYYTNYLVFKTKEKWIDEIKALTKQNARFKAIYVTVAEVKTSVDVLVSI